MAIFPFLVVLWLAGIGLAPHVAAPYWLWLAAAGLALAALWLLWPKRRLRWVLAAGVALSLGAARYASAQPPLGAPDFIATYNDRGSVTLEGVIDSEVISVDGEATIRLRAERLWLPDADEPMVVNGLVQFSAPRDADDRLSQTGAAAYAYGDRLRVSGTLQTPPVFDSFSYRDYLAGQDVYALLRPTQIEFVTASQGNPVWAALLAFKAHALNALAQIFPEPEAALLSGILLGRDEGLPPDVVTAFQRTGTSHIIAISGFNLAILAGLVAAVMRRATGRWLGLGVTVGVIVVYTLLVGASASVVRAAIMAVLALGARQVGRPARGLGGLAAAAWFMTLNDPLTLWDVGFQLSVMATLGLVLYAEPLEAAVARLAERWLPAPRAQRAAALAAELVLLTLAAQITTLPLILYHFRQLSIVALAANMLVLPVQPAVMVGGGLALLLGLAWLPLGQVAAGLVWPLVAYTLRMVALLAALPGAAVPLGATGPALLLIAYGALFGGTWLASRPTNQQPRWWRELKPQRKALTGLALLSAVTVLTWAWYFSFPPSDGRLRVTLLDLAPPAGAPSGGEALLIQTPSGRTVLIGGGPGDLTLTRALDKTLPLFTRQLDVLVVASPSSEHLGALPGVLPRFALSQAVLTNAPGDSTAYRALLSEFTELGIEVLAAGGQPVIDLGDGVQLRVLADTAHGSLLRLEAGNFALVAAPGLTAADAADFVSIGLAQPATALLLADHGGDAANPAGWIAALNPRVVLLAAQAGSPPDQALLDRLADRTMLRTDRDGAITLATDGTQLWVETER